MNYWPATDGRLPPPFDEDIGTSEVVAERLRDADVVKTLNHVGYHDLERYARPPGSVDRRALGVAGDAPDAVATVSAFIDRIGYDAVPVGAAQRRPGAATWRSGVRRSAAPRGLPACRSQSHRTAEGVPCR